MDPGVTSVVTPPVRLISQEAGSRCALRLSIPAPRQRQCQRQRQPSKMTWGPGPTPTLSSSEPAGSPAGAAPTLPPAWPTYSRLPPAVTGEGSPSFRKRSFIATFCRREKGSRGSPHVGNDGAPSSEPTVASRRHNVINEKHAWCFRLIWFPAKTNEPSRCLFPGAQPDPLVFQELQAQPAIRRSVPRKAGPARDHAGQASFDG